MRPLIHLRLFCLFVFLVVISSPGVLPAQTPVPDVTVNGADGEVTLVLPERLTVSLALDNKGITSAHDWWIAIAAPFGLFFMTLTGLTETPTPIYQGPLVSLPPVTLIDLSLPCSFPPGRYVFAFGVDSPPDGIVNLEGLSLDVTVASIVRGGQCGSGLATDFELAVNADMDVNAPGAGTFTAFCSGTIEVSVPVYRPDADAQAVGGAGDLVISGNGATSDGSGTVSVQGTVHVGVTGQLTQSAQAELHLNLAVSSNETMTFCSSRGCTAPVPMPDPHCPIPRQLILPVRDGHVEEWSFEPTPGMGMHYKVVVHPL